MTDTAQALRATLAQRHPELYQTSPEYRAGVETLARTLPRFLDVLAEDATLEAGRRAMAAAQLERFPGVPAPLPTDTHTSDLVLAGTAITPGRRYWTCQTYGHGIHPRDDFVHTAGPCTLDTPGTGPTTELDSQARP